MSISMLRLLRKHGELLHGNDCDMHYLCGGKEEVVLHAGWWVSFSLYIGLSVVGAALCSLLLVDWSSCIYLL